ncbi:MAG TPA: hypothetical protein VNX86_15580 [Rhizomicrobium sp.]|jgi:hypothetical protein|nr:hypothetical protein [Rhizomicrobium sp.]
MFTFLFGIFAVFWSAIFAVVGVSLFVGLVIPFLLLALVFRLGLVLVKLGLAVVLIALLSVCLF